jgi:MscS family membrane protein
MPADLKLVLFGIDLFPFIALLAIIFVTYASYFVILKLLESRLLREVPEEQREFRESLVKLARTPLKLVLFTFVVWIGTQLFEIPDAIQSLVRALVIILVGVATLYFLLRLIDTLVAYFKPKVARTESKMDDNLLHVARVTMRAFTVIVLVLVVLQNLNIDITGLVAGLGIAGLAVALAAQETLSNIFGAVTIFVDRPFRVGDAVKVEGFTGSIEDIGLRSTRLRTFDGTLVTLPNSVIAKANIDNLSLRPTRRTNFTIGVTYDTSSEKLQRAVEILRDVLGSHPGTAQYRAYFNSYGDFSLNILVQHWCQYLDYEEYLKCIEEINFDIKRRFEDEGIEFAFPSQTLYVIPEKPLEIVSGSSSDQRAQQPFTE